MSSLKILFLTSLTMLAFAGNSILCRMALEETSIDAMSFTSIRLVSGALSLWLIIRFTRNTQKGQGNWVSASALFIYAAGFSFAYINIPTATGALILFSSVQITMIIYGFQIGERLIIKQVIGLVMAFIGLIILLFPGLSAPPIASTTLMLVSGIAWGIYSLLGKRSGDATQITTGNFLRTIPITLFFSLAMFANIKLDTQGAMLAIASGALASGFGYAIWYAVLPALKSASAATIQLSVPVIAAVGGIIFLGEVITIRLVVATLAILGGITLVVTVKGKASRRERPNLSD